MPFFFASVWLCGRVVPPLLPSPLPPRTLSTLFWAYSHFLRKIERRSFSHCAKLAVLRLVTNNSSIARPARVRLWPSFDLAPDPWPQIQFIDDYWFGGSCVYRDSLLLLRRRSRVRPKLLVNKTKKSRNERCKSTRFCRVVVGKMKTRPEICTPRRAVAWQITI